MESELTAEEREQMRKFAAFKRVSLGILVKWFWFVVAVFGVVSFAFSTFLVWHTAKSTHRFSATTRLLYSPRQIMHSQNMSDKQLMSILDRKSLKRRVGRVLSMPNADRMSLNADLTIKQERKPSNLFTLTANASSWVGAVRKVNAYAEILIAEYITYRKRDLDAWSEVLELRKKTLTDQIAALEAEESVAKGKAGVASPVETLTILNGLISDQRRNYSMLSVQMANEEVKRKKLEGAVGKMGEAIIKCAPLIRKKSAELAALDAEIARLRDVYTDRNPKVMGKLDDRKELMDDFVGMLRENGIEGINLEDVEQVEQSVRELADIQLRMEVLAESQRSLEHEIKQNEARSEELTAAIPQIERIRVKRDEFERKERELEEQQGNIEYLLMTSDNDLQQIERAGGAGDEGPFSVKNFILAIIGAAVCTLALTFWIVVIELFFGKVRGAKELAAYEDVLVVGSIPRPKVVSEDMEKDVLGVVALNFASANIPKGIILVCRLAGSPDTSKFEAELEWSMSMAGQRIFNLEVVPSMDFEPPEGSETMINTVRKGERGWFPAANRYALAPTEIEMIKVDVTALRAEFDTVFIHMPGGLRRGGNFFSQLLDISESAMLIIGTGTTPRSELAYVRKHVSDASKPMLGLVAGATAKTVRAEMEEAR